MTDKEKLNKKAEEEKENQDAPIKPDPETLGPDPQEKMEGPISSIVKKIAEEGDDEDMEEEKKEKGKE